MPNGCARSIPNTKYGSPFWDTCSEAEHRVPRIAYSPACLGVRQSLALLEGQRNVMIGIRNGETVYVPFIEAIRRDKPLDKRLVEILDELSI